MIKVWTDGAYSNRSGCGGWAWAASLTEYDSGAVAPTTNNRMELQAALQAMLHFYRNPQPLHIISDSMYLVGCMNDKWWVKWERDGWVRHPSARRPQPVINQDLWKRIIKGVRMYEQGLTFEHVKGHSGDRMNEFVDQLAVEQRLLLEGEA